jgi:thiol:disulfide interchange protein DsbC
MRTSLLILCFFLWAMPALAKDMEKCGSQNCVDCHTMDVQEASAVLGQLVDRVHNVQYAEVPGFWVVEIEKDSQRLPIYIDFSKQYLVSGNVLRLSDMANLTQEYSARLNKVDVSKIPLDDALLLGSPAAGTKAIVFTDPECPFCIKMHASMQEAVARDPDIAFLIKLFPLMKIHPNAYAISKSIVCSRSMELLEKSFAKQPVPPATCETSVIDETLALTAELGIRSTPTLVLPDGRLMPGFKQADDLLRLLGSKTQQTKTQ